MAGARVVCLWARCSSPDGVVSSASSFTPRARTVSRVKEDDINKQTNTNKHKQTQTNTNEHKRTQTNTNKQTNKQINTQTNKQTNKHTNKHTQTHKQTTFIFPSHRRRPRLIIQPSWRLLKKKQASLQQDAHPTTEYSYSIALFPHRHRSQVLLLLYLPPSSANSSPSYLWHAHAKSVNYVTRWERAT